jgi:transcriptional regulator with XRE-family HTH domain
MDRTKKRRTGAEDLEIGRKIRALRHGRGMSQSNLAEGIGLTFQQVQKYEKGTNRVSAARLQRIADILGVDVTFFYAQGNAAKRKQAREAGAAEGDGFAYLQQRGAVRLMRAYSEISSRSTKYALVTLAESLRDG